ncbi:hypothetical protein DPMN_146902 [Dreissena polymorpha]|uniref:Uncharacterized protein n=1 Tax=Dreissena polymorpha TaxID=45954 RepID=A0A9D4F8S8_DREPO|nr:hypothetical protein DPMN_146902 [Dreissena polymorpha]
MLPSEAANVVDTVCTNGGTECSGIAHALCDIATFKCKCAAYSTATTTTCTATACTANATCVTPDANSECSGASSADKCRCKTGYSLASTDAKCYKDVTSTVCTATGKECDSIINALCDTTALKCKCGGISSMIANTCTGKTCIAAATCTALDANSECSGTAATDKCQCKSGYLMGTDGKCALSMICRIV